MDATDYRKEIGRRIRHERERQGLSLDMLALLSGLNPGNIYAYEYGHVQQSFARCRAIATALGVPVSTLCPDMKGA